MERPLWKHALYVLFEEVCLFLFGGVSYCLIEITWRGYTHWTMGIVGGFCFLGIGLLNNLIGWDMPLRVQMFCSAIIVTVTEFIAGVILNIWLGLNIWDYSNLPCNILGQVCLLYTFLWFILSLPAIFMDDVIRWKIFKEEKPHYIW